MSGWRKFEFFRTPYLPLKYFLRKNKDTFVMQRFYLIPMITTVSRKMMLLINLDSCINGLVEPKYGQE